MKNLSINGAVRFNVLKRLLPGISNTVLSERLLEIERERLITKKIYSEIPMRVEYSLTKRTTELESILKQLTNWVNKWKYYENNKNKIMSTTTTTTAETAK